MNVNVKFALSDEDKRKIRAAIGRGGMATRSEVRVFVQHAYAEALRGAPEPKARRATATPEARASADHARQAAVDAADDAVCANCGRPKKSGHGAMAFSCLPTPGEPIAGRRIFTPQTNDGEL